MKKDLSITLPPEEGFDLPGIRKAVAFKAGLSEADAFELRIKKRSVDARGRKINIRIDAEIYILEKPAPLISFQPKLQNVSAADPVVVIGSGPAGLFAAIQLIEEGLKPIILERGKDVRARRRDIAAINKEHIVNPESNYCFGEGGAGTFSDGKLYTRSKKRGDIRKVLEILVAYGASENILFESHPHIGTNKLPKIIENIREGILDAGGEIHFNSRVTDLIIEDQEVRGVTVAGKEYVEGKAVILATGHSAHDIFHLLDKKNIFIESKPFALGLRVEHPQQLIDSIQYNCTSRGPYLPAAPYSLVTQTSVEQVQRGVFSFCMCPGGFIVPSATNPGEVVVNGMSPSRRNSRFANSGIVVSVENEDLLDYGSNGSLTALSFQNEIEKKACTMAGGDQTAPAQRLVDFVNGVLSNSLPDCSYQPGLASVQLNEVLPDSIYLRLSQAFKDFGKKMNGYFTNEAVLVGVESRTSSPVRITRNRDTLEHIQINRLYPCGEGAGYAGGIVSAAMDGMKCACMVAMKYGGKLKFGAVK